VSAAANAEKLKFALFIAEKIAERVPVRFIQPDHLILFIE
jgi:hypothetical protein